MCRETAINNDTIQLLREIVLAFYMAVMHTFILIQANPIVCAGNEFGDGTTVYKRGTVNMYMPVLPMPKTSKQRICMDTINRRSLGIRVDSRRHCKSGAAAYYCQALYPRTSNGNISSATISFELHVTVEK
jgi:hypothetical protein